ncbi:hypothetical protein ACIQVU_11300 [Lysinibacillus sp. NPDC098008]|uniref:hypothetical protein n=1 Tax=Lysinibacillus sp. NPDC098008 TaxID=3364146 RepID=UPI0037F69178
MWYWFEEYCLINLKYNTQENYRRVIKNTLLPQSIIMLCMILHQQYCKNGLMANIVRDFLGNHYPSFIVSLKHAVHPWDF